jgi:hypothetical protein
MMMMMMMMVVVVVVAFSVWTLLGTLPVSIWGFSVLSLIKGEMDEEVEVMSGS